MSISTIKSQENNPILMAIIYILAILGAGMLVYFGGNLLKNILSLGAKAGLTVEVLNDPADVYVNGEKAGTTPFKSLEIKPGDNNIKIQSGARTYQTTLKFIKDANKIPFVDIKRDLGVSDVFSSGQNAWYEQSSQNVLTVIAEPSGAGVFVDGTEIGKTPFSTNTLTDGEYDLRIEYPGYESQSARIKIQKGYNLNISIKLFPMPVPSRVGLFEGSDLLYDVSLDNQVVTADTDAWVKAIIYWNKGRGINLANMGVSKEPVFDFYLTYKGDLYNKTGEIVTNQSLTDLAKSAKKGAYLGKISDGAGLTAAAKTTFELLGKGGVGGGKKAVVKPTPTGWLNVRDMASTNGKVLTKVNVGESYDVLEQTTGWVKIRVNESVVGWISTDYADVK